MYAWRRIQFTRMCVIHSRPRDGTVGSAPPPHRQPVSLVLSRHGRTDVMAMKDMLAQHSTPAPAHALGGRATVPAHQRRQPPRSYPNDTDHRAGRPPHPATWASLPDTGAWTIARNCRSHRWDTHYTMALRSPPSVSCYRKPSRQPGYRRLHLVGAAAVSFCKHVACLHSKRG